MLRQPVAQEFPGDSVRHRLPMTALTCAVALVLSVALAGARTPLPEDANSAEGEANQRFREGTDIVDLTGHFRMTGDRVTFFTDDGKGRYVGLENLNLERIYRMIADNPNRLQWIVSGTLTEYSGTNYILVRRAVLKKLVRDFDIGPE